MHYGVAARGARLRQALQAEEATDETQLAGRERNAHEGCLQGWGGGSPGRVDATKGGGLKPLPAELGSKLGLWAAAAVPGLLR